MADRQERQRARSALRHFLASEAAGGLLLMAAAALALLVANSPLAAAYHQLLETRTGPLLTPKLGPMTVHLWINDGLMALFFLLVGLEIRREFVQGQLATPEKRRLPVIAAVAGMAVPAFLYLAIAGGDRHRLRDRCARFGRQPGPGLAPAVPDQRGHRRRSRRRRDHRARL